MSKPLISIGMPVYNGGEKMRKALDVLLAQTEQNFELIISDNCSTDGLTQKITEEYARNDSRIRLIRQPVNLGAQGNFLWLVQQAKGEYFMWAAHDDCWSTNYVEVLSKCLNDAPKAVLATAFTEIEYLEKDGSSTHATTLMAPNADRWKTLNVFSEVFGFIWIYGMFRTDWLKKTAPEIPSLPFYNFELIWMFGMMLTRQVVGSDSAVFYSKQLRGKYKRTYRQKMELWASVLYHQTRLSWTLLPPSERLYGIQKAFQFVYRNHVTRRNPIGTSIRIVKLAALWSLFGVEAITRRVGSLFSRSVVVDDQPQLKLTENAKASDTPQQQRRAA